MFFQLQLQQQMQRHADAMEEARLQSEGTIENLRKKLNTLQEVIQETFYNICHTTCAMPSTFYHTSWGSNMDPIEIDS